jgi:large subunit ribosomal protein L15
MVTNRTRKVRKLRGTRCCGYGPNKHRGAGQRGGRGRAGSGKKCDSKKTKIWGTKPSHLGSKGFASRYKADSCLNICDVEAKLDKWLEKGLIVKEGALFIVDLKKLGFDKLLGGGKIRHKMKIVVPSASARVEEKLKAEGCELVKQ